MCKPSVDRFPPQISYSRLSISVLRVYYAGALLSAVGGIALVSLLLAPRYYLHIHHSVWSLFLVFLFRYEKWWSRYAQALALGIYIDGLASWGLSSIWHLTS